MLKEGGVRPLSLRAVAARAGVTPGSVYHHYKSKTELLGVVAGGGFVELRRELDRACQAAAPPMKLRAWTTGYNSFAQREPALFALMFEPEVARLPSVAEPRAALVAHLRGFIGAVWSSPDHSVDETDAITVAVWAAAHGAAALDVSTPSGARLIDEVIAGFDVLLGLRRT